MITQRMELCILLALSLLLALVLAGLPPAMAWSPLSPIPPRDYYPADPWDCVGHCRADDGDTEWCEAYCGVATETPMVNEPPRRPLPRATVTPTPTQPVVPRTYIGLWWRGPDVACQLWWDGTYTLDVCGPYGGE